MITFLFTPQHELLYISFILADVIFDEHFIIILYFLSFDRLSFLWTWIL